VLTVLVGLSSALCYATCDMLSQRVSRIAGPLRVLCWTLPAGVVIILPIALSINGLPATRAEWEAVGYCAGAGVLYLAVWVTLLRALQVGDLSLVLPLASLSGLFTAVFSLLRGSRLTLLLGLGIGFAVIGGTLAAMQGRAKSAAGAGWALISCVLWTLTIVLFGQAEQIPWLSQVSWARLVSLLALVPFAFVISRRARRRPSNPDPSRLGLRGILICIVAGIVELIGLTAMTIAVQRGPFMLAGIAVAQVATMGVILGLLFLGERPRVHQLVGVACTLIGVTLLSTAA
jgi:drug/metabolite transporter (DMT)-like permease